MMQIICQIISTYYAGGCADELTNEPVLTVAQKHLFHKGTRVHAFDIYANLLDTYGHQEGEGFN